ncbi:MAG: iron chaperone [Candidatus Promineifilaceae bacterium]
MRSTKAETIDEYIAGFPSDVQAVLEQVRATIKAAAPDAEETISYAIPTFKLHGRYLVYFAGFKDHIGFYPAPVGIEAFQEELSGYKSGKGSVQFPLSKPLPLDLITRIVKYRAQENLAKKK